MEDFATATKNLQGVVNSVVNAKAPERFTNKFLEDLGYKSSNDRLYVGIFKALGLIDDNGIPLPRYYEFIDQTETGKVLTVGIQEAYEDLFNLRKDAQTLTVDEIKNKLKTLTQGQKSENVLGWMANTFKALCDIADWASTPKTSNPTNDSSVKKSDSDIPIKSSDIKNEHKTKNPTSNENAMNLHYNIQIHLPETTNMSVYDAIFQSLKKHLL